MATAYWTPEDWERDTISKKIGVPKRASSLAHWIRMVKKTIEEVPLSYAEATVQMDEDNIKINWDGIGYLHIDRTTRKAV